MLMTKHIPTSWSVPTLVALFKEKSGSRTIFQVTDEAAYYVGLHARYQSMTLNLFLLLVQFRFIPGVTSSTDNYDRLKQ